MTVARHLIIPLCPHLQEELVTIKVSLIVSRISYGIILVFIFSGSCKTGFAPCPCCLMGCSETGFPVVYSSYMYVQRAVVISQNV
jgi:hypothetical protein